MLPKCGLRFSGRGKKHPFHHVLQHERGNSVAEDFTNSQADPESDEGLLMRYRKEHDELAFRTLYERRRPELRVFLARRLEGALAAQVEDILQDTFSKLAQHRQQTGRPGNYVRGLLYRIADDYCTDFIRASEAQKRGNRITCHADDTDDGQQVVDERASPKVHEAKMDLAELMAKLPPPEAEAVRMVELEGYTMPSAAVTLGLPESTVWSRVRTGRKRLREFANA